MEWDGFRFFFCDRVDGKVFICKRWFSVYRMLFIGFFLSVRLLWGKYGCCRLFGEFMWGSELGKECV